MISVLEKPKTSPDPAVPSVADNAASGPSVRGLGWARAWEGMQPRRGSEQAAAWG